MADDDMKPNLSHRIRDLEQELATERAAVDEAKGRVAEAAQAIQMYREARDAALGRESDAQAAHEKARNRASTAEEQLAEVKAQLQEKTKIEKRVEEDLKTRTAMRDFVSQSLAEIMTGVDDAAYLAGARLLEESDNLLISPSRLGAEHRGTETLVHFDLAVIVNAEEMKKFKEAKSKEVGAKLSMPFLEVFNASIGGSKASRQESGQETREAMTNHNRIRFSVPVVFASQPGETG